MRFGTGVWLLGLGVAVQLALAAGASAATVAPQNLKVSGVTTTHMDVSWDPPTEPGITSASALAYQATPTATEYRAKGSVDSLTSGHVDNLACGTAYRIVANFYDGVSRSPAGELVASTAPCTKPAPAAPSSLAAAPLAAEAIQFTWAANDDPAISYKVTKVEGPLAGDSFLSLSSPETSFTRHRLVCGESYRFSVFWVNDEGRPSDIASTPAKTLDCSTLGPPKPGPTSVQVTRTDLSGYTLRWEHPPADVIGYRLDASGPGVSTSMYDNTFTTEDTFRRIPFTAACGQTYSVAVSWVYSDGGISQPTSAGAAAPACSPTPTGGSPPPADTTGPVVRLAPLLGFDAKSFRPNRKGAIALRLACGSSEDHCTGTVTLRAGKDGKRVRLRGVLGTASFHLRGGTARNVSVRLRRQALAALKRTRSLKLVLRIVAHDDTGNTATRTVHVRVLANQRTASRTIA